MGKEQYSGGAGKIERVAGALRNGGIVAGLIGLVVSESLMALGILIAVGGEIVRRSQKER